VWVTLQLCIYAAAIAVVLGTIMAGFRVSPIGILRLVSTGWVNLFRDTPLAVVMFFAAFALPELGLKAEYFTFAYWALGIYTSAFIAEALRSGINSVPAGQAEAARAIGFTFSQNLRMVILPQAFSTAIPPLVSTLIAMIKNSAIAGLTGVSTELAGAGDALSAQGYAIGPVLLGVLLGYWALTLPSGFLLGYVERRLAVAR
jgi:glutamate transport system permease protein